MPLPKIAASAAHAIPTDLRTALALSQKTLAAWNDITPLARNAWICWVISAKLPATRARRIARTREELARGKRRPCCFAECPHR